MIIIYGRGLLFTYHANFFGDFETLKRFENLNR